MASSDRFKDFHPSYDLLNRSITRSETLALVDALSLSLTEKAWSSADPTAAEVIGQMANALQDVRYELYSRMNQEQTSGNGATDYSTMADYGAAPNTRKSRSAWGTPVAKANLPQRLLFKAIRKLRG